ncbi:MAG: ArsC/Spx/MgsR family protein [Candidatus Caldarchaeales archaeon]
MSPALKFYYRKGCKTCAAVREQLERRGVELEPVELKEAAPPEDLIRALIERYGLERVVRRRTPRELRERASRLGSQEAARFLAEHPEALERPILVGDRGPFLAWDEEMAGLHGLGTLRAGAPRRRTRRTGRK